MRAIMFKGFGKDTEITLAGVRFTAWETELVSDEVAQACLKRHYFEERPIEASAPKRRGRPTKVRDDEPSATQE